MINVTQWGLISNYLLLRSAISGLMNKIYSAFLPSFGNLIAKGSKERQLQVFNVYDMANSWIYAFCFVALASLSSTFISLYFGEKNIVGETTIFFLFFAFYIDGLRTPISALWEASGDKWLTILAAVVNLITSIIFVIQCGLSGVYMGTICAMLILLFGRPYILFRGQKLCTEYFMVLLCHIMLGVMAYLITHILCCLVESQYGISIQSFFLMIVLIVFIPNLIWLVYYHQTDKFKDFCKLIRQLYK